MLRPGMHVRWLLAPAAPWTGSRPDLIVLSLRMAGGAREGGTWRTAGLVGKAWARSGTKVPSRCWDDACWVRSTPRCVRRQKTLPPPPPPCSGRRSRRSLPVFGAAVGKEW